MQIQTYNDAVKSFKFQSRYIAFIDGDEFIFPKSAGGGVIATVVDEVLSPNPNAAGLAIHWQNFGSNGQEKADYSRGVLERFTRRAPKDYTPDKGETNALIKTIANPRKINFLSSPHFPYYFADVYSINEIAIPVSGGYGKPVTAEKIVVNHYLCKSIEEYMQKTSRGPADGNMQVYSMRKAYLEFNDRNDEFDDGILRYRAERAKTFQPPDKSRADERLFTALATNLSPTLVPTTPPQFYAGKMETFLTCRAVAAYLKTRLTDDAPAKFFEEASLVAILRTIASGGMSLADARLLIRELPDLLPLPYPVVNDLRGACLQIIPQMMNVMRVNWMWKDFTDLDYLQRLLKTWK